MTRPNLTLLSRRVSQFLGTDFTNYDVALARCTSLTPDLLDAADFFRSVGDNIMADTLHGWIGKCQRHAGLQE